MAFLSAASLGVVALRDLVVTTDVELTHVKSELSRLRTDCETARNGLDERLRIQEIRPPRVGPEVQELHKKLHEIELKQAELCERLKDCRRQ